MPRKREVPKRLILPDPTFHDVLVAKFINTMMLQGKKAIAEEIMYSALELIGKKVKDDPIHVFRKAVEQVKPVIEVRSRRVGGATYQVPTDVRPERRQALAFRWIISAARGRPEKTMEERLAGEFLDAFGQRGTAFKKREDVHRMAEANKAFAHYRW